MEASFMTDIDDPLALRNIKKGDSPGAISGLEFLTRYHKCSTRFKQGSESHPLRMAEQTDARVIWRARQPVENAVTVSGHAPAKKAKRIKREPPKPDADGRYRL